MLKCVGKCWGRCGKGFWGMEEVREEVWGSFGRGVKKCVGVWGGVEMCWEKCKKCFGVWVEWESAGKMWKSVLRCGEVRGKVWRMWERVG